MWNMSTMNPAELGYFEKRPGSNVWYRPGGDRNIYEPRVCENSACGKDFMGKRSPPQRFCSAACTPQHQRKADAGYRSVHKRVERARGKASGHLCVSCGHQAETWSQIHGTSGLDPAEYEPRCWSCHNIYDHPDQRGEAHPAAKLTEARARGIRASVGATDEEMAEVHDVSATTVWQVRHGETWRHIMTPEEVAASYDDLENDPRRDSHDAEKRPAHDTDRAAGSGPRGSGPDSGGDRQQRRAMAGADHPEPAPRAWQRR